MENERNASWKERLVVIDTAATWQPGGAARADALLFDPGNKHTPYIVAHAYDPATRSWSHGSYRNDLMDALCDLRGCKHPDYSIPGMTPERLILDYGKRYEIPSDLAIEIAEDVNNSLSTAVDWELEAMDVEAFLAEYDIRPRSQPDLVSESDLRDILSQLGVDSGLDLDAEAVDAREASACMTDLDSQGRGVQTR